MRPVELPSAVAEVFITNRLLERPSPAPDYRRENLAIHDLTKAMVDRPADVLPRLVRLAMESCEANSAGVSVLEPAQGVFRWLGLAGKLAVFEGATIPRDHSACGVCLDCGCPILLERPERAYDWLRDAGIAVPEVLLIPLSVAGEGPLGTLWVVAKEGQHFDAGHAHFLAELAAFTGVALRMILTEERLKRALEEQETLAGEMSHRVKNVFAIADSLVRMTSMHTTTKDEMTEALTGRIHAFGEAHALARGALSESARTEGVSLAEVIERVLLPYGGPAARISGPEIRLGEHATTNMALVFHELATNAAKYGSLSQGTGSVLVDWGQEDGQLCVQWNEIGGPDAAPPAKQGFGSTLIKAAVASHGGTIDYDWKRQGLLARIMAPVDRLAH